MGAGVSLPGRKNLHERAPDGETSPSLKQPPLPARGLLRTLGFKRSAVQLPHTGSWLEVTVFEARDLPAADDNGLSDPYVEIRMEGETSSRKTNVRMKTLKPKWQQELLLPVSADRAVGELTKKGAAEACYWFTSGNKLAVQVWDWNASTEDELLGSVALDLRALSMSRFEVELSREEDAFQARLAKNATSASFFRSRKPAADTGTPTDATHGAAGSHAAGNAVGQGAGGSAETAEAGGAQATVTDATPDFKGKIRLEGRQVMRWVTLNAPHHHGGGGELLLGFRWRWARTDVTDALLSVHIGGGSFLPAMDPDGFSDPFVRVEVLGQSEATRVCYRTLFPHWDETIRMLVKTQDLLQTSLRLTVLDDDGADKPPDPMGSVQVPLQELSATTPLKERLYLVSLDKRLRGPDDLDDGRLVDKPADNKDSRDVLHEQQQLVCPYPEEPVPGQPGLHFSVELGPVRAATKPDLCARVTLQHAQHLLHPEASRRRSKVGPDVVVCVGLAGREKKTKLRLANAAPVWNQTLKMDLWSDMLDATLVLQVNHHKRGRAISLSPSISLICISTYLYI